MQVDTGDDPAGGGGAVIATFPMPQVFSGGGVEQKKGGGVSAMFCTNLLCWPFSMCEMPSLWNAGIPDLEGRRFSGLEFRISGSWFGVRRVGEFRDSFAWIYSVVAGAEVHFREGDGGEVSRGGSSPRSAHAPLFHLPPRRPRCAPHPLFRGSPPRTSATDSAEERGG